MWRFMGLIVVCLVILIALVLAPNPPRVSDDNDGLLVLCPPHGPCRAFDAENVQFNADGSVSFDSKQDGRVRTNFAAYFATDNTVAKEIRGSTQPGG